MSFIEYVICNVYVMFKLYFRSSFLLSLPQSKKCIKSVAHSVIMSPCSLIGACKETTLYWRIFHLYVMGRGRLGNVSSVSPS